MEESPIIDSPSENKPPFLALGLGVFAVVLGGVALVLSVRTQETLKNYEQQTVGADTAPLTKKVEDAELKVASLERALTERNTENASLKSRVERLESASATLTNWTQKNVVDVANRVAKLEARGGVGAPQNPPRQPPATPGGNTVGNNNTGNPTGNTVAGGLYTVVEKDNFTKIAQKFGVTISAIEVANPGVDSFRLRPGQKLKIPAKETAPVAAPRSNTGATPARPAR